MDFFAHQDAARKASRRLTVLFVLAVIGVVAAVNVAIAVAAGDASPPLIGAVSLVTLLVILGGSMVKTAMLRDGGSAVAEMMGGRRISQATSAFAEKRLMNVVEEMAIAAGVPVPQVYVMDHEPGINAFAAGYSPNDAAIAVTYGLMESMNRDELQGVIAHEFSHVLNGDMRLNIRMIGLLFGVEMIGHGGRICFRIGGHSDGRAAMAIFAFGGVLMAIGSVGLLATNLIRAAVSRQREFLADASSVQFTRNPDGIGSALIKIATEGGLIDHSATAEVSHMFIASAMKSRVSGAFATHPPIEVRIERVLGSSGKMRLREAAGKRSRGEPRDFERFGRTPAAAGNESAAFGRAGAADARASGFAGGAATMAVAAEHILASVGNPGSHHVDYAKLLIATLPDDIRSALERVDGAKGIIIALLAADAKPEANLGAIIAAAGETETGEAARRMIESLRERNQHLRMPIVQLALPALRAMPREHRLRFAELVQRIVMADERITPFELALSVMLTRALEDGAARAKPTKFANLEPLKDDVAIVLSLFVRIASEGSVLFDRIMKDLGLPGATLLAPSAIKMEEVGRSLGRLAQLAPLKKPQFIKACLASVIADGRIAVREAELMRAVCATIDSPLPPIIDIQVADALAPEQEAHAQ
ncbi:MAG: M48 family metallopeptidase [Burkholderiales bacterium]